MKILKTLFLKGLAFCAGCCMLACEADLPTEDPPEVDISELRVDLRAQQTPMRSQGNRNTCITFAATAALEAAYKRLGYGDKDLSEEFMNYMGKTLWLHHRPGELLWDEIAVNGEGGRENQVGAFGGGGGAGYIKDMTVSGLKIPLETEMPYRFDSYATNPNLFPYGDPRFEKQWYINSFNLDKDNLSRELLHSENFHGVAASQFYNDREHAGNPDFIEGVLKRKMEVVWDFRGNTKTGHIWRPCGAGESGCRGDIAHSMLIVGFDRTDPDPDNHYFMVKNSWGGDHASTADSDSLTYISYDFVRQFGYAMAYIQLPVLNISQWEPVKLVGRWNLVFDGHEGVLDIYHLPGYWQEDDLGVPDRRIGSFYTGDNAFRVNGSFEGNKVTFYISGTKPNLRWDELEGRKFEYYYSNLDYMAGFHTDEDGKKYGGYAVKADKFSGGSLTPRPFLPKSYANSTWDITINERKGHITLAGLLPYEGEFPENYDISGTYTDEATGATGRVTFRMPQTEYNHFFIQLQAGDEVISLEGRHLNHKPGNIAGHTTGAAETKYPFYMIRR